MTPASETPGIRRPGVVLAVAAALSALVVIGARGWLAGPRAEWVILATLVLATCAALAASARRALCSGPDSRGWRMLSLYLLISVLIQASRLPALLGHPLPAAVGAASFVLMLAGSGFQFAALLLWNTGPRGHFARLRHGLDSLLFTLAIFFILWALVLGPLFLSDRFPLGARLLWLEIFLVYALLLGLTLYLGLPEPGRFRGPLGWLAAAFLLACLFNFDHLMVQLTGAPLLHLPFGSNLAIPLAYLGAALSARPVGGAPAPPEPSSATNLVPYAPFIGATVLGVWMLVTSADPGHRPILVWLALSLMVVLLVRQYLALKDVALLSHSLETRVAERTAALERAQTLLLRTERMNALATAGAGLAHDMNNLLQAVRSQTDLVILGLDKGRPVQRIDLLRILEATELAADRGSRLMALGRPEEEPPQRLDLAVELQEILPLLRALLPRRLGLRLTCSPGPIPFLGTRRMLEQILVNLVANARDALAGDGAISLRARGPLPGEEPAGPLLEVEDNGSGIPEEHRAQVFQPFFTTKSAGKGTGIGLVSVKTMLDQAGGAIDFTSTCGQGTVFRIRLPRIP